MNNPKNLPKSLHTLKVLTNLGAYIARTTGQGAGPAVAIVLQQLNYGQYTDSYGLEARAVAAIQKLQKLTRDAE